MGGVAAFLDMGGYGGFVWPAFALTAAVLIGLLVASLRALRAREADLEALQDPERRTARRSRREVPREA